MPPRVCTIESAGAACHDANPRRHDPDRHRILSEAQSGLCPGTQFVIVPEPATIVSAGIGITMADDLPPLPVSCGGKIVRRAP